VWPWAQKRHTMFMNLCNENFEILGFSLHRLCAAPSIYWSHTSRIFVSSYYLFNTTCFGLNGHHQVYKFIDENYCSAAGTCLPSRCLAMKEEYILPCVCLRAIAGIHVQTHTLMGGIYGVRHWDGLRCHVTSIHTYCNMTSESRNSSLLGNGWENAFPRKRTRVTMEERCFLWLAPRSLLLNGAVNTSLQQWINTQQ
jgi:hypothetical protein